MRTTLLRNKILIRELDKGVPGPWRRWRPKPRFVRPPTIEGLRGWLTKYRGQTMFRSEELTLNAKLANVYDHGKSHQFLVHLARPQPQPLPDVVAYKSEDESGPFTVIMERAVRSDGKDVSKWEEFRPGQGFDGEHTLEGLRNWMQRNKEFGWEQCRMRSGYDFDPHVVHYGTDKAPMQFWVPSDKPVILFRSILSGKDSSGNCRYEQWREFIPAEAAGALPSHSVEGLREWMRRNAKNYNWHVASLSHVSGHVWVHGTSHQFWIPGANDAPRPRLTGLRVYVCVNAIGCPNLTEGQKYQAVEGGDELLSLKDDDGEEREFLLERFKVEG